MSCSVTHITSVSLSGFEVKGCKVGWGACRLMNVVTARSGGEEHALPSSPPVGEPCTGTYPPRTFHHLLASGLGFFSWNKTSVNASK